MHRCYEVRCVCVHESPVRNAALWVLVVSVWTELTWVCVWVESVCDEERNSLSLCYEVCAWITCAKCRIVGFSCVCVNRTNLSLCLSFSCVKKISESALELFVCVCEITCVCLGFSCVCVMRGELEFQLSCVCERNNLSLCLRFSCNILVSLKTGQEHIRGF